MPKVEFSAEALARANRLADDMLASREEVDAKVDPAWNAKYGDHSWDAALFQLGIVDAQGNPKKGATPEPTLEERKTDGRAMVQFLYHRPARVDDDSCTRAQT